MKQLVLLGIAVFSLNLTGCGSGGMSSSTSSSSNPGGSGTTPQDCTFNSTAVLNGNSVTAYQAATVPSGQTCVSQQRTCSNGTLSGSYAFASCVVTTPTTQSCVLDGVTVLHNQSRNFFNSASVACGQTCQSLSRTCNNGVLSGSATYNRANCSVAACNPCALPWGGTINSGQSVTAYQASSVPNGQSCVSQSRTCSNGTLSGSYANVSCTVQPPPPPPTTGNLFQTMPASGTVSVTLHPGATVTAGQTKRVVFGVPFPRGTVTSINNIRVLNSSDQEIPSQVTLINSWRNIESPSAVISVRSARIVIDYQFANLNPVVVKIQWGQARVLSITGTIDTKSTWVSISQGANPTEYPAAENIQEPSVFATLPADWMSQCLLQTRTTGQNEVSIYSWFDDAFASFSNQAVASSYATTSEPWLYDRAQTLFIRYFRSGDVQWLRRAHRAAQFYKNKIQTNGDFSLKVGDAKYVYGQSMNYNLMLTGDSTLVPVIERTLQPHSGWTTNYSASTGFWTERNAAYALQAAMAAFDATGNATYAQRATNLFNGYFNHQQNPINGWTRNGCQLHTRDQHDPSEDIPDVMCSTWMGALLADAVWKYYLLSNNNNALVYLADFADYVVNYGLYTDGSGYRLPYYAASSYGHSPADGDMEHTCDVLGSLAKGNWAQRALNRNPAAVETQVAELTDSCQANLEDASLSPPRKYNWWFGTTSDWQWLLSNLP